MSRHCREVFAEADLQRVSDHITANDRNFLLYGDAGSGFQRPSGALDWKAGSDGDDGQIRLLSSEFSEQRVTECDVPLDRVINTWPADELLRWVRAA